MAINFFEEGGLLNFYKAGGAIAIRKTNFHSHKNHNPDCDILEGYIDDDSFITYGVYVKDTKEHKKEDEFMEYYSGENYVPGSKKRSNSKMFLAGEIPVKYANAWLDLRNEYNSKYKEESGDGAKLADGGSIDGKPKFKKGDIVVSDNGSVFKITEFRKTKTDTWYEGDYYTFFGEPKVGGKIKTINERDIMGYYDLENSKVDYVEPYKKLAEGGAVEGYRLVTKPSFKYQNTARRWLEDHNENSLAYKLAVMLLTGVENPDEELSLDSNRYGRLLRVLDGISESKHEMSWRTENYTLGEAEKWALESVKEIFDVEPKMETGGAVGGDKWLVTLIVDGKEVEEEVVANDKADAESKAIGLHPGSHVSKELGTINLAKIYRENLGRKYAAGGGVSTITGGKVNTESDEYSISNYDKDTVRAIRGVNNSYLNLEGLQIKLRALAKRDGMLSKAMYGMFEKDIERLGGKMPEGIIVSSQLADGGAVDIEEGIAETPALVIVDAWGKYASKHGKDEDDIEDFNEWLNSDKYHGLASQLSGGDKKKAIKEFQVQHREPVDDFATGGSVRSPKEYNKLVDQKQKLVENLSPKEVAEMWNANSHAVKDGISKPWTESQGKLDYAKMYLRNLLIENEITEAEYMKYFATGGAVDDFAGGEKGGDIGADRMYNFLKDDWGKFEKAVNEGDKEEVDRFFSYWIGSNGNGHLKSLKTTANDRMYNFLKDDLEKLEKAVNEGDKEEIDRFFSYWGYHLKSLKMAEGGAVQPDTLVEAIGVLSAWETYAKRHDKDIDDIDDFNAYLNKEHASLSSKKKQAAIREFAQQIHKGDEEFATGGEVKGSKKEWCVEYLPSTEDEFKIEKGFFSKEEAEKWAKGENIYNRADEVNIHQVGERRKYPAEVKVAEKYVAVHENKDGYWTIASKPVDSKKIAEILAAGAPRGETGKAVTLKEAKEHKKVLGREYLEMAEGGTVSKAFAKKKDAVIAYAIDNMDNLEDWGVPAGLLQNRRESRWKIATILDEKFDDDYIISKYDDIMKMAEGGTVGKIYTINVPVDDENPQGEKKKVDVKLTGNKDGKKLWAESIDGKSVYLVDEDELENPNFLVGIGSEILISSYGHDRNVKMKLIEVTPLTDNDIKDGLGRRSYHFVGSKNRSQWYPEAMLQKKMDAGEINFTKKLAEGGEVKPIAPTEHYRYLDIIKYPNGLELAINEEGREEVKDLQEGEMGDYEIMGELFDTVQGNSEYMWHEDLGDRGFGLTSAPGITDGYYYDDDSKLTDKGQEDSAELYSFMGYEIHSPLELLLRDGKVFFARVPKEGDELDEKGVPVKKKKGKKHETGGDVQIKVGDKLDVINPDMINGEEEENGCEIISVKSPTKMLVKLSSDPSLKCEVELINGRWEITADVETKGLVLKNITKNKYVETEKNGKVILTKKLEDAMRFWKDGDESESDAEATLALLNEQHKDSYSLIETDDVQ